MANFGETLRRERELRDISLREIADATKINLRYLEALEQNRFDILPGGVFNKGFIRAYARFIGADGETLVDGYLQEMAAREAQANGGGAATPAAGLHRPSESPKRRAGSDSAAPAEGTPGNGGTAAPGIVATDAGARPAAVPAAGPAPHLVFLEAQAARAGASSGPRPVIIAMSLAGVVAVALLGVWLVRSLRHAPARKAAPVPAAVLGPSTMESPVTTDPGAALTTTSDIMHAEPPPGGTDATAGAAAGTTLTPALADPGPGATPGQAFPRTVPPSRQTEPVRREGPVDRPADPLSAYRQSTSPQHVQIASQVAPPPPGLAAPAPQAEPAPPGSMEFRIEATAPVWVQIACDGDERLNRALQPGEGVTLRCLSFIRLSVTDIGAVRLMVNGGRCAAPGDRGSRIEGFVIRAEDAAVICPNQQGGTHGRS